MKSPPPSLLLQIRLEQPVPGVTHALQKGKGNAYALEQRQTAGDTDLSFEIPVTVKDADSVPDFSGPFVQGPRGGRFIYINIGTSAGQHDSPWTRRLKVPLAGIDALLLREGGGRLSARVPGRGRDGTPNCATVTPFSGWKAGF